MEDFVNFGLAQKLKEKGFREKCLAYYDVEDNVGLLYNTQYSDELCPCQYTELLVSYNSGDIVSNLDTSDNCIDAPTISQVLNWMRDEKKLHIEFVGNACGYLYIVSDIPSEGGTDRYCSDYSGPNAGGTWNNYEDCALNAIQYVLDNLI